MFRRACVDWGLQNDKDWFRKGKPTRKKAVEELRGVIKEVYDNKCYLSGRPLDMEWGKNLEFDHIIPKSKGGSNNLDNLGVCTREANGAKQDLSLDEWNCPECGFLVQVGEICIYCGYDKNTNE